jgi:hypothetical protein
LSISKLSVVDLGVVGQFTQVSAQKGEMVFVVHTAHLAQMVGGGFVIQVANQGIARVGRHRQDATLVQQSDGLFEQTNLRIFGVNRKILSHENSSHQDSTGMT